MNNLYDYDTITLEKIRFEFEQILGLEILDPKSEIYIDHAKQHLVHRVRGFVWGEDVGVQSVKYPVNWWQAFKERWFTKKLLRKYPVKYKTVEFNYKILYPDFKPSIPDNQFRWYVIRNEW